MKVQQVQDKTKVERNHIYVIPPSKQLTLKDDELILSDKEPGKQAVIDIFFRSMAAGCEKLAIGIILSGTGSDGTLGLKAVKEYGGVTMVQDPQEADYGGMPRSAIESDNVDFIMPVKKLAKKVMAHNEILGKVNVSLSEQGLSSEDNEALLKIFNLLSSKKGHDFKHYKRPSVLRRLQRRMFVTNKHSISKYQKYLEKNPNEVTELFKDLLISVTNFFRDPEAFKVLEKKVIPKLFENKDPEDPIRVWVTGCATGEEVYSLAILMHEYAAKLNYVPQIKIFGTDISDEALRIARKGIYPETIATDVSKKRLLRYFHKEGARYRVCWDIREMVLISKHDVLSDPPFVNQDLITCRNLLIYFSQNLQNEVLKIIHYALHTGGYLFLGMADSTIGSKDLFAPVNKSKGVYKTRKVPATQRVIPRFPLQVKADKSKSFGTDNRSNRIDYTFDKVHHSLLAAQYAPASVIIDENNQVMHSSKGIHKYLNYAEGEPTRDLLKMVSAQVQRSLRNIIFQFNKQEKPKTISKKVKLKEDATGKLLLKIRPIDVTDFPKGFRQVTFEKVKEPDQSISTVLREDNLELQESQIVEQLEDELEQAKEQLQQTIEEYETSNEELMASNEELQSMNEELQTTTEELETSKEELQSVNEELRSVNQELEIKIDELKQVNDDLKNLMEATDVGILFLDKKLNVRLFTSSVTEIFHLINSDVGRPISDVTHELAYDQLMSDLREMLSTSEQLQHLVATEDGSKWYIMKMKPYKTTEYNIEGAVVAFVDITDLKHAEEQLKYRANNDKELAELGKFTLESNKPQPIMDRALQMLSENLDTDFTALMKLAPGEGHLLFEAGTGWPDEFEETSVVLSENTAAGYVLNQQDSVIVEDFKNDDRFSSSDWLLDQGVTSGINVLVKGSRQQYGVLGVYSKVPRTFTAHEVYFVQTTANFIGEAIERINNENNLKKAYKELETKVEAQQKLQKEILEVEKEERWRLGQYLHDSTAQSLLAIKMLLDIVDPKLKQLDEETQQELEKIKRMVVKAESNIRELSHFVLPIDDQENVSGAFQKLKKQVSELYNVNFVLDSDSVLDKIEDQTTATSLYYITQEAVRNAVNHGNADKVEISFFIDEDRLKLIIKDNGMGYDEEIAGDGRGVNIMKHRADLLGGTLNIKGNQEKGGTQLTCSIPLERITKTK